MTSPKREDVIWNFPKIQLKSNNKVQVGLVVCVTMKGLELRRLHVS